jgi:glycine cleavage system T protein (aminomethyltransferase)
MSAGESLTQSPLHERHVALGAKFAEFGGWEMPLEYKATGVLKEHAAVREAVGVFDVSHLGKLVIRGVGAVASLNACLSNDLDRLGSGQAQYTLACDAATGGIVDDLIAYRHADDHVLLVPNAANTDAVRGRLKEGLPKDLSIEDQHRTHAVLAVQGPRSDEVLSALGLPVGHEYMAFAVASYDGHEVVVCRTGYTGERGYELIVENAGAGALWDALMTAGELHGITACGLGARDTLRTEMGYPLHGQDISLDVTPVQARLGWAVGWKKPAFWGKDFLVDQKEAGTQITLRGLVAQGRGIARPGMTVRLSADLPIGHVTSGTFSPTLRQGVALALISSEVEEGAEVTVDVRGRGEIFVVTRPPFVHTDVRGAS